MSVCLVHVWDHDPGLEKEGKVHDDVLVSGQGAFHGLQHKVFYHKLERDKKRAITRDI